MRPHERERGEISWQRGHPENPSAGERRGRALVAIFAANSDSRRFWTDPYLTEEDVDRQLQLSEIDKALRYAEAFERISATERGVGEYETTLEAMLDTHQNPFAARARYYEELAISVIEIHRPALAEKLNDRYSETTRRFGTARKKGDRETISRLEQELREFTASVSKALREIRGELIHTTP
jgi:hypothetical protein